MEIISKPTRSTVLEEAKGLALEMLILSRDGKYVINTARKKVFVWDAKSGSLLAQKKMSYALPYVAIIDAFDAKIIAYHGKDIVFISIPEIGETHRIANAHKERILTVRLCPNVKCFLSASKHEIKVWDLNGNLMWKIDKANVDLGYMAPAFDPESLLFAYSRKSSVIIHNIETDSQLYIDGCTPNIRPIPGDPSVVSKKHNLVISTSEESIVNFYSITPPSCLATMILEQPLTAVRYNLISDKILICSATSKMFIIDPRTFTVRVVFVGMNSGIFDAAWTKNGLRVLYWRGYNKKEQFLVSDFYI